MGTSTLASEFQQLRRLRDWPRRLHALVESRRSTPFRWGYHDCCTWAAECVQAVTGTDLSGPWKGQYDCALSAKRYLLARWGSLPEALEAHGLIPVSPEQARRGDLGLYAPSHLLARQALGVCLSAHYAMPGLNEPMSFIPRNQITSAWKVG